MPNTKITKQRLSYHWEYARWMYVTALIVAIAGVNLCYSIFAYRSPPERRIDVYFVSTPMLDEELTAMAQKALPHFEGNLNVEEINMYSIPVIGTDDAATYEQKLMVMIGAQEGDIYIFPQDRFYSYGKGELFLPLDEYIADDRLDTGERDLTYTTLAAGGEYDDDGNEIAPPGEEHIYGVPIDDLIGLRYMGLLTDNMVMSITAYSRNQDNAVEMMNWIMENLKDAPIIEEVQGDQPPAE